MDGPAELSFKPITHSGAATLLLSAIRVGWHEVKD